MDKKILFVFCLCVLSGCAIGELDFEENRNKETVNNGTK